MLGHNKALKLSKVWYKVIEKKLLYDTINLGEMVDYFVYLYYMDHPIILNEIREKTLKNRARENSKKMLIDHVLEILNRRNKRKSKNNKRKIMFFVNDAKILPVIKRAQQDKKNNIFVIATGYTPRIELIKNKIYYKKLNDYESKKIKKIVSRKKGEFIRLRKKIPGKDNIYDLLFEIKFPEIIKTIELIKIIINKEKPDIFVNMEDTWPVQKAIVSAMNLYKIPTLVILHGILTPNHPFNLFSAKTATKTAVWGPLMKKIYVSVGVDKNRVVATGAPQFDVLHDYPLVENNSIVFLTEPIKERENIFKNVLKVMEKFPENNLIVKVHPRENVDFYRKIAKKMNKKAEITQKADLYGILSKCKLVILCTSTTGLEAMMLDKPVISLSVGDFGQDTIYKGTKAVISVNNFKNFQDIALHIKKILTNSVIKKQLNKARKKFIYDCAYKQDGKATERIYKLMEEMIKNRAG